MKKTNFIYGLVLALGMASCNQFELENPTGQSNPQLPGFESSNLKVEQGESVINLDAALQSATPVTVAKVTELKGFPTSEYNLVLEMEIDTAKTFATAVSLPASLDSTDLQVSAAAFNRTISENFTKNPVKLDIYGRVAAYAQRGTTKIRLGSTANYFYANDMKYSVTPLTPARPIETEYYLVGSFCNWDIAKAVKLNHSGANQYDQPEFKVNVTVTDAQAEEGWNWKIISGSAFKAGKWEGEYAQFGPQNTDAMKGILVNVATPAAQGSGVIKDSGKYGLTINLETLAYEFQSLVDILYTPGNTNGWNQVNSQVLTTTNFINYAGFCHLNGDFKISTKPSWSGINYGDGGNGKLTTDGGAGNLSVSEDGLYRLTVDLNVMSWDAKQITTFGVIGDATPNGWDASTPLTPSADFLKWTADITFGNGEFKFRANDGWDINLGGSLTDLKQNGNNLPSPGAGTYTVTLDLSKVPYTCTIVSK